MIEATLENCFELLATAPRGVPLLREMVLGAALRGQLNVTSVDQQTIRLKGNGKALLQEFPIPKSWKWCLVGELCDLKTGATPSRSKKEYFGGSIPWLVSGDIHKQEIFECEGRITQEGMANSNCKLLPKNSVLIALNGQGKTRATVALLRLSAACNQSLVAMVPKRDSVISPEFLFWNLRYRYREIRHITGDKQRRGLNMGLVGQLSIAVPPIEEQHRIVTRVEELMRLCDALDAKGQLEATQHAQLVSTLLGTLTESETPEQLADNWHRIASHFDLLLDRPEAVDALEQTILQLAVRGLLVHQNPQDEPASELLKKIRAAKDKLITEGKIKRDKPLPPVAEDEQPSMLPRGWKVSRFGDYFFELCTGPFGSVIHKEDYVEGGVPLINPSHMIRGRISHDPSVSVSSAMAEQLGAYRLTAGDVLLARRGEVGRYALVTENEDGWLCGTGSFFVKLHEACNREFLGLILEDPDLRRHLLGESVGSTMTNLNQRILIETPIALPPLAEQSRIVTRVAQLRRLCGDLRQRLTASQSTQAQLAEALVKEVA